MAGLLFHGWSKSFVKDASSNYGEVLCIANCIKSSTSLEYLYILMLCEDPVSIHESSELILGHYYYNVLMFWKVMSSPRSSDPDADNGSDSPPEGGKDPKLLRWSPWEDRAPGASRLESGPTAGMQGAPKVFQGSGGDEGVVRRWRLAAQLSLSNPT